MTLGLFLCKGILKMCEGTATVENKASDKQRIPMDGILNVPIILTKWLLHDKKISQIATQQGDGYIKSCPLTVTK